ncbi:anti-anti sigma factor HsbA [Rhodocyclaceae bacterium]
MQIDSVNLPTHVLVRLTGRFDFSTRERFIAYIKETIARAEAPEIQIDLAAVVYIDSSALGMLLMARDLARQHEKEVTLANPQPLVRQTLETAQFSRLFKFI